MERVVAASIDRQSLASLLTPFLTGRGGAEGQEALRDRGPVKSFGLEVDGPTARGEAAEFAEELASRSGLSIFNTSDDALFVLANDAVELFVDVLDPRFWLLHTVSPSAKAHATIRHFLWDARVDSCWFPQLFLEQIPADRQATWFKADFRGTDLLPVTGVRDKRLRIQVEGDGATDLLAHLAETEYRTAAALTGVATRVGGAGSEFQLDEIIQFNGRFVARGASFEAHVGFVADVVRRYAEMVRSIEARDRLTWSGSHDRGFTLDGELVTIDLSRQISDMERFLGGLFSCREPFRLWGVPKQVSESYFTAEVVDLHVGERMTMDITPDRIFVYLTPNSCGNTALRLLSNLQHRYDATASFVRRAA